MGTNKLDGVVVNFPDPNSYIDSMKTSFAFRNGSMGGEVMSRFTVVFNFPQEELYFKKNAGFKKPFHYNLSGLIVRVNGAQLNVFEITEVRRESAADKAGIMAGDQIVSINGITYPMLNLNLVNAFFNNRPHKKIRLEINRKGERLRKEFELEDAI